MGMAMRQQSPAEVHHQKVAELGLDPGVFRTHFDRSGRRSVAEGGRVHVPVYGAFTRARRRQTAAAVSLRT